MKDLVCLLGLVLLIEGLPYFVMPAAMKRLMSQLPRLPDGSLRRWGLLAIGVGLFLIYLGRR